MNNILINNKNNTLRAGKEEYRFTNEKVKNISIIDRSEDFGRLLYTKGHQQYKRDFWVVCGTITYSPEISI